MTLYNFEIKKANGDIIPPSYLEEKVVLVVNTATQCGLTPQMKGLEILHQKYHQKGLVILGFPCNQFGGQEPLRNQEMVSHCQLVLGVTFILTEKVKVNGPKAHPLFVYLKQEKKSLLGASIKWNFAKFLVDKNGLPVKRFSPTTPPSKLESAIEKLLL